MGYYANGKGGITFKGTVSEDEFSNIRDLLSEAFECDGEREWKATSASDPITYFDIWENDKYYGDVVEDTLRKVADIADIMEGSIEYIGEDDSLWRFIYRDGEWIEQNGHVEYNDYDAEKLAGALRSYAAFDLEGSEIAYVKSVLRGVCGLDDTELIELGLGYLLD